MRIAVIGAGEMGSRFGGLLAHAGEDVSLLARGDRLAAILADGLTVTTHDQGTVTVRVPATDQAETIGLVDLILFCVKDYDTATAAAQTRPLVAADTLVISVQNGVDCAERIGAVLGHEHLLGGVGPGNLDGKVLLFGELAGGTSTRTEQLGAMFERAGLSVAVDRDIRVSVWRKFLMFCAFGGVATVTRLPYRALVACPETRALCRGALEEGVAIGHACGIALPEGFVDHALGFVEGLPLQARPSQYRDLIAGRRLEIDYLNGTLVRLGTEQGIATPLNFALYAAIKPYADGSPTLS